MAYQVDKFNGTFLTSVEDGTIDTTTDIRFVGKNYAGYGEVQNENFLHILENFANTTPPPRAVIGQIWYDSTSTEKKLKFYDGNQWKVASGARVATIAPSGLTTGEFWWNSSSRQLYTWDGTEFVLVGPEVAPDAGVSSVVAQRVKDTSRTTEYSILKFIVGGNTVAIASSDEFTLSDLDNPIADFSRIKKGITLVNTPTTGISSDNYVFWGSASNALKLGGVDAANYLQRGDNSFSEEVSFADPGFTVGNAPDLRVNVENDDEVIFENLLGNPLRFRITVTQVTDERDVLVITSTAAEPGSNNVYNLGSTSKAWNAIYGTSIFGNLTGNVTGDLTGTVTGTIRASDSTILINSTSKQIGYAGANLVGTLDGTVTGNCEGTANNATKLNGLEANSAVPSPLVSTIPVRDDSGNITANQFIGITDKADRLKIDDSATDSDPNYRSAKTTKTANTIAARDGSGNLLANLFDGTATAAQYADLAEKYLPDAEYDVGTVVAVGGEKEITAAKLGDRAIGVISANPAFMMNKDLEGGVYVALKGRVPVKVTGTIKKGDRIVSTDNGVAIKATYQQYHEIFAIALESSDDVGTKLIEAIIV
jgi:hypothetical protein